MIKQWILTLLAKRIKMASIDRVVTKPNYNIDEISDSFVPIHRLNQQ